MRKVLKVRTKDNTSPLVFWRHCLVAFRDRGLPDPTFGPVHDAYDIGHSPETFADYELGAREHDAEREQRMVAAYVSEGLGE